ncbi:MAG TPA: GNAT family N-acetyltransferase [Coriobacteriia bacterium]
MTDPTDIRVVSALPGDARTILAIQRLAFAPAATRYSIPDLPPLVETREQVETAIRGSVVLKAVDATGRILGAVRGEDRDGCVYVGRLVVDPAEQRRGVATLLMTELEDRFPEARVFELFTGNVNEPGMGLYLKLGYTECRRESVTDLLEVVYLSKPGPRAAATGE